LRKTGSSGEKRSAARAEDSDHVRKGPELFEKRLGKLGARHESDINVARRFAGNRSLGRER